MALGVLGVAILLIASIHDAPSLVALVLFDVVVTLALLVWARPSDDIALILLLLLTYYSLPFPVALVLQTVDPTDTAIPLLDSFGLRPLSDVPTYALSLLLFKCGLVATYTASSVGAQRMSWEQDLSRGRSEVIALLVLIAAGLVFQEATESSLFLAVVRFSVAHAAYLVVLSGRGNTSRLVRFLGLTAVSFLITRSRSVMAVAAMGLLGAEWQRTKKVGVGLALVAGVSILLASAYGVYRDEGSSESFIVAITDGARFEASGESGLVFQCASHVVGLRDASLLPPDFSDSLVDKVVRAIPLFPGKTTMLADRYVRYFFPAVAAAGGGFAFSGVAESYLYSGRLGVLCYSVILGLIYSWIRRKAHDGSWRTVLLILSLQAVRSEFALVLITLFWGAVWVVAFNATRVVFAKLERR